MGIRWRRGVDQNLRTLLIVSKPPRRVGPYQNKVAYAGLRQGYNQQFVARLFQYSMGVRKISRAKTFYESKR